MQIIAKISLLIQLLASNIQVRRSISFSEAIKYIKPQLTIASISLIGAFLAYIIIISSYKLHSKQIISKLEHNADLMLASFNEKINSTSFVMKFINSKIILDPNNINHIDNILQTFRNTIKIQDLTWTIFSWVNADNILIVDSFYGIMQEPIDLNNRDYLAQTRIAHDVLHIGQPVYGSTSSQWMIPVGVGTKNNNGNYVGSITLGIRIDTLIHSLNKITNSDGIYFFLLDKKANLIGKSTDKIDSDYAESLGVKLLTQTTTKGILNKQQILSKHNEYAIYQKFANGDYTLVTMFDRKISNAIIRNDLLTRLTVFLILSLFLLIALLTKYKVILPLKEVSLIMDKIRNGEKISKIPAKPLP